MRRSGTIYAISAFLSMNASICFSQESSTFSVPLIPKPLQVELSPTERMSFDPGNPIILNPELEEEAAWFLSWIGIGAPDYEGNLILSLDPGLGETGQEGYTIEIDQYAVRIRARTEAGVFYGLQTLRQLLPAGLESEKGPPPWELATGTIVDRPRFEWRGLMLDSARNMQSVDEIKGILDNMASLKLNRFHWHLTDDQGWRIPIDALPKLESVAAWREVPGKGRYGGVYSKDDIRGIVAYAHERKILIVPEIDMPGHMSAAVAAYPEISASAVKVSVPYSWGIYNRFLNPASEKTYDFIAKVLKETLELFPDPWFHIGGDEVMDPKVWAENASCAAKMKELGISDPLKLQDYFTSRVERMVLASGRILVGWDDIQSPKRDLSTILQFWSHANLAKAGIKEGRKIVVSYNAYAYLDMNYSAPQKKLWAGYIPTRQAYALEPSKFGFDDSSVLGIEGALWTELIPTKNELDQKLYPRLPALAETAWSQASSRSWEDWRLRARKMGERWAGMGINFYRDPEIWF